MIRAAQTPARPLEAVQAVHSMHAVQVTRALDAAEWPVSERRSPDWAGLREGAREVFLTLAATLAIGFAWAAIETAWTGAEPGPVAASGIESRYDGRARVER